MTLNKKGNPDGFPFFYCLLVLEISRLGLRSEAAAKCEGLCN